MCKASRGRLREENQVGWERLKEGGGEGNKREQQMIYIYMNEDAIIQPTALYTNLKINLKKERSYMMVHTSEPSTQEAEAVSLRPPHG